MDGSDIPDTFSYLSVHSVLLFSPFLFLMISPHLAGEDVWLYTLLHGCFLGLLSNLTKEKIGVIPHCQNTTFFLCPGSE